MTILDAIEMSNDDRQYFGALHSLRVGFPRVPSEGL